MPILGINYEKCSKCMQCVLDCPALLFDEDETGKIIYSDPKGLCILCGHCISVCPEDAILREKMEDVDTFPNVEKPEKLVSYKSLFQLFRAKRSIRQYKKAKVPQDVLQKVFDAMRYAPSGANRRAWKYFVISDSKKIKALSDAIIQEFTRNPTFQMMLGEKFKQKQVRNIDPIFYNAPHIIILYTFEESQVDTGIAMTYGMLAAQTLGLGTCWIGFAKIAFDLSRQIKNLAGVKGRVSGVMTLGYPAVRYHRCPPRAPVKIKGLKEEVKQFISE